MNRLSVLAATAAVVLIPCLAHAATIYGGPAYDSVARTGYTLPFLPYRPGSTAGNGVGVGSAQKVTAGVGGGARPIRWDAAGGVTELENLGTNGGSTFSGVNAVNATGIAVGYASKYETPSGQGLRAVRWDAAGTATELGILNTGPGNSTSSIAYAVNASGTAVGFARRYNINLMFGQRAVRWEAGGTAATELGHLGTDNGGNTSSYAYAVNASGTTVGVATKYTNGNNNSLGYRAVRWDAGSTVATELGNLGTDSNGSTGGFLESIRPNAVNDSGTAVGFATKFTNGVDVGSRAVRWDAGGTAATELAGLGTGASNPFSQAFAVNAAGTTAGVASKFNNGTNVGSRAVRWEAGGTAATELGSLGVSDSGSTSGAAYAMNSAGIAVGLMQKYVAGESPGNRAVAWGLDNVALDLNTLLSPADAAAWTLTEARGISDTNWVTGLGTYDPDGTGSLRSYERAFLIQVPEPAGLAALALLALPLTRRRRQDT